MGPKCISMCQLKLRGIEEAIILALATITQGYLSFPGTAT